MSASLFLRLDEPTLAALDELARKTDRSRDWLVARAIENFIAYDDWRIRKIEEGIDAAEGGDFASEEEVARVRRKFAALIEASLDEPCAARPGADRRPRGAQ